MTEPHNRKLSIATDPTLSNPDSRQWKQRLEAFSYARKNVGYSLGSDVHDQLVLLPALWEGGVEGQFEMEVYCNLPFCLSRWVLCALCSVLLDLFPAQPRHRIDPSEINAPVLTTRQKSIMAREAAAKAAEEKEKLKRIAEHRRASNQVRWGLSRRRFEWPSRVFLAGLRRILGLRLSSSSLLSYERLFPY